MTPARVVVVGAGPAGSATAWRAARAGLEVLLLDAREFPRSKPCGDALSPGATPFLREMGVLEAIEAGRPARLAGWKVRSRDGTWFRGVFADPHAAAPATGYALPRERLDAVLLDAARSAGARFLPRRRVFDVLREGSRVRGVVARGPDGRPERHDAALVVGADGLRSRIARLLGGVRHGRRRRLALVGRWEGIGPGAAGAGPRHGEMRLGTDGVLGLAPTGPDRANLTLVVPAAEAPAIAVDPRGYYEARLREYGVGGRIAGARLATDLEVTGPFEIVPRRLTAPGALLVGDAAGYFDPFTGQGIHRALAMAEAAGRAVPRILDAGARRGGAARNGTAGEREAAARGDYERAVRRLLVPSRRLQRLIDGVIARPAAMDAVARLLAARPGPASLLVDVTGDRLPPAALLDPRRIAAALWEGRGFRPRRRSARVHA